LPLKFATFALRSCSPVFELSDRSGRETLPLCVKSAHHDNAEDLVADHRHDLFFAARRLGKCCASGVSQPMEVRVGKPGYI
jgi:hypothetical protein